MSAAPPIEPRCPRCDGCRWVCETHRDRPWEGPRACGCCGAPCPVCNQVDKDAVPEMPSDFIPDRD